MIKKYGKQFVTGIEIVVKLSELKEEIENFDIDIEDFVKFHNKEWENNLGEKLLDVDKMENRFEIIEWEDDYRMFLKFIKNQLKQNLGIE